MLTLVLDDLHFVLFESYFKGVLQNKNNGDEKYIF